MNTLSKHSKCIFSPNCTYEQKFTGYWNKDCIGFLGNCPSSKSSVSRWSIVRIGAIVSMSLKGGGGDWGWGLGVGVRRGGGGGGGGESGQFTYHAGSLEIRALIKATNVLRDSGRCQLALHHCTMWQNKC